MAVLQEKGGLGGSCMAEEIFLAETALRQSHDIIQVDS